MLDQAALTHAHVALLQLHAHLRAHRMHIAAAGMIFRNFRHPTMSLLALKRLYVEHGLLEDEDAPLEIIKIDTLDEMCQFLSGPCTYVVGPYPPSVLPTEPDPPRQGDLTV